MGLTAGDAGTYTAFADNGLGPPATAAVSLSVDPASDGTNVPASVIELEPGKRDRKTHERREKCTSSSAVLRSNSKVILAHRQVSEGLFNQGGKFRRRLSGQQVGKISGRTVTQVNASTTVLPSCFFIFFDMLEGVVKSMKQACNSTYPEPGPFGSSI